MTEHKITRATGKDTNALLSYLKSDVAKNAFAIYDLLSESEKTTFFLARDDVGDIIGYLLIYRGTVYPSIILNSSEDVAEGLLRLVPRKGILFIPPTLLSIARENIVTTGIYAEDQMGITRKGAKLCPSDTAYRLTTDNAREVAGLYSSGPLGGSRNSSRDATRKWMRKNSFFGVAINGNLVAVAGTHVIASEVSVIGGVYTHPLFRGRGLAKVVTSALVRHLFGISKIITLYVLSDNQIAISAYRALGFEKIGERFWVDMGTGWQP